MFNAIKDKLVDSRAYVQKYQRFLPVISFFAGFTWDSLTITRIDAVSDNLIIGLYLIFLGFLIVLTLRNEQNRLKNPLLIKYRSWFPNGIQFFLGGLFSAYVVFYFKSASFCSLTVGSSPEVANRRAEYLLNVLASINEQSSVSKFMNKPEVRPNSLTVSLAIGR